MKWQRVARLKAERAEAAKAEAEAEAQVGEKRLSASSECENSREAPPVNVSVPLAGRGTQRAPRDLLEGRLCKTLAVIRLASRRIRCSENAKCQVPNATIATVPYFIREF